MFDPTKQRPKFNRIERARELNSQTSLCQLPGEVLTRILKLAQQAPDGHNRVKNDPVYYSWNPPVHGWTRILLVCSHIYDTAVQVPGLWSTIDCEWNPSRISFLLSRAKDTPLILRAYASNSEFDHHIYSLTEKNFSRAQAAFLILKANSTSNPFAGTLNTPAPKLLCLEYRDGLKSFNVSAKFLGGGQSSLSKLVLTNVKVEDAPEFPVLRHLELSGVSTDHHLIGLLTLLARVQQLENLYIEHLQRTYNEVTQGTHVHTQIAPAFLPCLRTLRIEDELISAEEILRVLPDPSTEFIIDFSCMDHSTLDRLTLAQHLPLLKRLRKFWRSVSAEDNLPGGIVKANCFISSGYRNAYGQIVSEIKNSISFGWPPHLERAGPRIYYKTSVNLLRLVHEIFRDVKTLHIVSIRRKLPADHRLELYKAAFPDLQILTVESVYRHKDLELITEWIEEREREGRPWTAVEFLDCKLDETDDTFDDNEDEDVDEGWGFEASE